MNLWTQTSTVVALALYIPLCMQIFQGKTRQNIVTWLLWTILDGVAAASLVVQKGNYLLPLAYTFGCAVTTLFILRSSKWEWGQFEKLITCLVIICALAWITSGPKTATVASAMAMCVAGLPQLLDTFQKPHEAPFWIYIGYLFCNSMSVIGAKNWSIEERFYPSSAAIYCLILITFAMRRFSNVVIQKRYVVT